MKTVIDMNLSPDWVAILLDAGYEALHWSSVGDPSASDKTILSWAATRDYIVFTHDLDFGAILAMTHAQCPSVIQLRAQDILPNTQADLVCKALKQFQDQLANGALITIDMSSARARILPI